MRTVEANWYRDFLYNLGREEVALQATLQAGSRIQRFSLMNYLG